jgi:hypothetical protein
MLEPRQDVQLATLAIARYALHFLPMNRPPSFSKPFRPRAVQPVSEVLKRADAFAPLRAGVEQLAALEKELGRFLPEYLVANVTAGSIKDGTLTLFAGHGALAARLRHLEPGLLHDLQQRGWAVNALKIRVQPKPLDNPQEPKRARVTAVGAACLQALSETLAPSPLQNALARMAARHVEKAPGQEPAPSETKLGK